MKVEKIARFDIYTCPYCGRTFPVGYVFTRSGTLNPLAKASAFNNFKSHRAACLTRKRKQLDNVSGGG